MNARVDRDLVLARRVASHVVPLFVVVALAALSACGGGSQAGSRTTTPEPGAASSAPELTPDNEGAAPAPEQPGGDAHGDSGSPAVDASAVQPLPAPPADASDQSLTLEKRQAKVQQHLADGRQAVERGDAKRAVAEAQSALSLDGYNVDAMVLLAHGAYLEGNLQKAERVLDDTVGDDLSTIADDTTSKAAREMALVYMLYGLIYERTAREKQALAAYGLAVEKRPDYVNAWINRGILLLKARKYEIGGEDGAMHCFGRAISALDAGGERSGSRRARTHMHLGSSYRGMATVIGSRDMARRDELLGKARDAFDAAIRAEQSYAPAYYNYGLLYLDAGAFPGMDDVSRLGAAVRKLSQYKELARPAVNHPVNGILAKAQEEEKAAKALKEFEEQQKLEEQQKPEQPAETETPSGEASDERGGTP